MALGFFLNISSCFFRKVVAAWLSADYLLYNHFLEK